MTQFEALPKAHYGYWLWTAESEGGCDYAVASVWAVYSDEHADQNVNWEVMKNGSPVERGYARSVRLAQDDALAALRDAIK
jgi:hypothetical protein